jgi:hypothetical protein
VTSTAPLGVGRGGDDLAAGTRHFLVRASVILREPASLGLLVLIALVTIPGWTYGLGIDLLTAMTHPVPTGARYSGPPASAVRLWLVQLSTGLVICQFFLAYLVAVAVTGTTVRPSAGTSGRVMPALPIGPRMRIAVDALVAMPFLIAARAIVLALGGEPLARLAAYGYWVRGSSYSAALALNTTLGLLFLFPAVLAWTSVVRFDRRGLVRPAVVMALLVCAAGVGAMAHLWSAALLALALSAFVLARPDDGSRADPGLDRGREVPRRRSSPGPLVQLRRDAWLGPLRVLGLFAAVVVLVPFVLAALVEQRAPQRYLLAQLAVLQLLALAVLPAFPLGLKLVPGAQAGTPFSGFFLRAASTLPLPRERVLRAVYFHALIAAGVGWLVLCAHVAAFGGGPGLPLFELPAVVLVAAIVVCEAVGDRTRGLLALTCLVGFQLGLPLGYAFVRDVLGLWGAAFQALGSVASVGRQLTVAAWALGLLGGLPVLVHLRRPAPAQRAAQVAAVSG